METEQRRRQNIRQFYMPRMRPLASFDGIDTSTKTATFKVYTPDSRLRVKISILFIPKAGGDPVTGIAATASIWLASLEQDQTGISGTDIPCNNLEGTEAAPATISAADGLYGYSKEFITGVDAIRGMFSATGDASTVGTWVLQVRYQPIAVSFSDAEWVELRTRMGVEVQGGTASGGPTPPPILNSPTGLTFSLLMKVTAGRPLTNPGQYIIAACEGANVPPPPLAWTTNHNNFTDLDGPWLGIGAGPPAYKNGFSDWEATSFDQPTGVSDDPGVLHCWTFRAKDNGPFSPGPGNTPVLWDVFRDGILQPGGGIDSGRPGTLIGYDTLVLRLGSNCANNVQAHVPSFSGVIGNVSLVQKALDDATIAARDIAALVGGLYSAVANEQVGLWPLQSSGADTGGQGLDFSVEVGAGGYVALGNGLNGFSFDGVTNLITPMSVLLACLFNRAIA